MSEQSTDVTCHWGGCDEQATHRVNWTTERRLQFLCDTHTERQKDAFSSEIEVTERTVNSDTDQEDTDA